MSLLTPSENHAFQSFLSSIDYANTLHSAAAAPEWTMYSAGELDPSPEDAPELLPVISQPHGKEALTKATRDLMALDASAYNDQHNSGSSGFSATEYANDQNQMECENEHDLPQIQQQSSDSQTRYTQGSLHPSQLFQFLKFRQNESPPDNRQHHRSTQRQTYSTTGSAPPLHIANPPSSTSSTRTGSSTSRERTTPSPSVETSHKAYSNTTASSSSTMRSPTPPSSSTFPLSQQQSKRSITHEPARQLSNKRPKPSPTVKSTPVDTKQSVGPPKLQTQTQQQQPTVPVIKASLLTPSQKKANHIQSEQKRRANIRRGYEALCEVVPALREAIRAEEGRSGECAEESTGKRGKRKRKSVREEREKADGRAGPRSENVVLQKTIDYITELTDEQAALLKRLHRARAALGNSTVSVPPVDGVPLWEREWTGGVGWNGQDEADEEDEEEG